MQTCLGRHIGMRSHECVYTGEGPRIITCRTGEYISRFGYGGVVLSRRYVIAEKHCHWNLVFGRFGEGDADRVADAFGQQRAEREA